MRTMELRDMARTSVPQNNDIAEQLRRVQGLGLRLEHLAILDPDSMNDVDRQAVTDVLRYALERLTRHDAASPTLAGLSSGASTLIRHLKGLAIGSIEYPDVWRELFASKEDAEAAVQELSREGLIKITEIPGKLLETSALGLTVKGQAALEMR